MRVINREVLPGGTFHMLQKTTNQSITSKPAARPRMRRRDAFFHVIKTGKLVSGLARDKRISLARKGLFFGAFGSFLVLLLFPDLLGEAFLSLILPLVGTVLGVPLDIGFDWLAFAPVIVGLL